MPPVGFEPTISAGERPQTYALDRAATETGRFVASNYYLLKHVSSDLAIIRQHKKIRKIHRGGFIATSSF